MPKPQSKQICYLILTLSLSLLQACGDPSVDQVSSQAAMHKQYIQTTKFKLATWQRSSQAHDSVNIYIEGDGRVRRTHRTIARDPTPHSTTMLQMAALDPAPQVVYLARPCQFSPDDLQTVCDSKYWTSARYSHEIVQSINEAISKIKQQTNAQSINLIGYSGGGTIAVLIAAKRNDIASIRTIAGNLDLQAMDQYHQTLPLTESLDPIAVAKQVQHIPQLHFVGAKDRIVPPHIATNFRNAANLKPEQIIIVDSVDHKHGWVENWLKLLEYVPYV